MTTLSWPTLTRGAPAEMRWRLLFNTQRADESSFSRSVQTSAQPGARWATSFVLEDLLEADWRILEAWLAELEGMANRFTLYDFAAAAPRGTITTSGVTLNGAVAYGAVQATLAGCGASKTLLRGDKFAVAGEVKIVTGSDFTATGGGAMSNVTFRPAVRAAAGWSNGASVTLSQPSATFMLTSDSYERLTRAPVRGDIPIDAVEAY